MRVFLSLCPEKYSIDLDQSSMVRIYLDHFFQLPISSAIFTPKTSKSLYSKARHLDDVSPMNRKSEFCLSLLPLIK
jgi:hypothetical protein